MAWGVKTMKFKSGSKVKIGNVVLEALQSQIIRDCHRRSQQGLLSRGADQNL